MKSSVVDGTMQFKVLSGTSPPPLSRHTAGSAHVMPVRRNCWISRRCVLNRILCLCSSETNLTFDDATHDGDNNNSTVDDSDQGSTINNADASATDAADDAATKPRPKVDRSSRKRRGN